MLDFLQTDSGCTIPVLFFRDKRFFFLHSSHKWEKGSIKERVVLDSTQITAQLSNWGWGLKVWPTSGRTLNPTIIQTHWSATLHTFQFHATVAQRIWLKMWDSRLFCKEVWSSVCSKCWGKACFKNGTTAHTQLSKFLQDAAPALWYNLHLRGRGC